MGIERSGLMARASAMAGEGLGGDGGVIRRDRPTASTGWSERWPAGLGLDRAAGSVRIPTEAGHPFRREAGQRSDLMSATIPR